LVSPPFTEETYPNDVPEIRKTNMKMKKEYFILAIIILGLSLYLAKRSPDRTRYELPEYPEIVKKDISRLDISKGDTSICLKKVDDKWYLSPEGYPANPDRVENMLNVIEGLTLTALVSESKDYSRYGLDDDSMVSVKAWTGEELARELEVGKMATSYRHTFVKLAGDESVYHAEGNFRNHFDQTEDALRDKGVLSFDPSAIVEIQITKGKDTTALVRTELPAETPEDQENIEMVWLAADGRQGDEEQLTKLLRILSNLQCETYIDDKKKKALADPIYTVRCKGAEDHHLSVFPKREKEAESYPAVSSDSDYPFLLPAWQVDSLMKEPEDILTKLEADEIKPDKGKTTPQ
jgi:hypothetical protein